MAGVGLDAAIVRAVSPGLKRLPASGRSGSRARQIVAWRPRRFLGGGDGRRRAATLAIIATPRSYGGGLRVAPGGPDGQAISWTCALRVARAPALPPPPRRGFPGKHLGLPGVTYLQVRQVEAHDDEETWVQVDGELIGQLPMTFECVPAALSLIVP